MNGKSYRNGNATVTIHENGIRTVQHEGKLELDDPLNVEIKLTTTSLRGRNPVDYDGIKCDYDKLKSITKTLPKGTELNLAINQIDEDLLIFIDWCKDRVVLCNLTINQIHVEKHLQEIKDLIRKVSIRELRISIMDVETFNRLPQEILNYRNTVANVHVGIDSVEVIPLLDVHRINCIGFNEEVETQSIFSKKVAQNFMHWKIETGNLISKSRIHFDKLATIQLDIYDYYTESELESITELEDDIVVDLNDCTYSPSYYSTEKIPFEDNTVRSYYHSLKNAERV